MGYWGIRGLAAVFLVAWLTLVAEPARAEAAKYNWKPGGAATVPDNNAQPIAAAATQKAAKKPAAAAKPGKKKKVAAKVRAAAKQKRVFTGTAGNGKTRKKKRGGSSNGDAAEARSKLDQTYKRSRSGGITWNASGACLPSSIKNALAAVARNFGPITVNSTGRSHRHNRRVGGAGKSLHLQCRAADFRVLSGRNRNVLAFLHRQPGLGGIKLYRRGYFHIDNGPRRTWGG